MWCIEGNRDSSKCSGDYALLAAFRDGGGVIGRNCANESRGDYVGVSDGGEGDVGEWRFVYFHWLELRSLADLMGRLYHQRCLLAGREGWDGECGIRC
jgi:hypothetical protein